MAGVFGTAAPPETGNSFGGESGQTGRLVCIRRKRRALAPGLATRFAPDQSDCAKPKPQESHGAWFWYAGGGSDGESPVANVVLILGVRGLAGAIIHAHVAVGIVTSASNGERKPEIIEIRRVHKQEVVVRIEPPGPIKPVMFWVLPA